MLSKRGNIHCNVTDLYDKFDCVPFFATRVSLYTDTNRSHPLCFRVFRQEKYRVAEDKTATTPPMDDVTDFQTVSASFDPETVAIRHTAIDRLAQNRRLFLEK